jgi:hypothetical protein
MFPTMRLVAAAVSALAIAPSSALAQSGHQHDFNIDKSEQFMELAGMQSKTATMSCPTGQIAVNGSVKVDAVDSPGHPQFVDTLTSRGFGARSWRFVVVNNNQSGRAQVKLFIVCIVGTAGTHGVALSEPGNDPATTVAETDATWDDQGSIGSGFFNDRTPRCPGTSPGIGVYPDPTLFPVRPSFAFRPSAGEMYTSDALLFSASGVTNTFGLQSRDWTFQFDTYGNDIATNAMTSIRCLGTHVAAVDGHRHAYDVSYQRVPHNVTVQPGTRAYDITVGCPKRNGSFGIIGVHSEFGGGRVTGSEPRGDVWAFRLANRGANPSVFQLGVICVEKRVWYSNGAVPPPAPIPQSVDTTVTTKRVGVSAGDTGTFTVGCKDKVRFALSGSMSIDRVSAGDIGVFEDIALTESRAVGLNKWRFTVENDSVGGANVSFRLVCLAPWTEGHAMVLSGVETSNVQAGEDTCAGNGQFPVQAGYSGAEASMMAPGRGAGSTAKPTWGFAFRGGAAKTSLACLYDQTTIRSNHYHQSYATVASKTATLPAGRAKTILVRCKAPERAVAGGLDASGTATRVVQSTPRGRSWRFQLVSLAKRAKVTAYATCLGKKTSGELFT